MGRERAVLMRVSGKDLLLFPASRELRNLLSEANSHTRLKISAVVFIRATKCLERPNREAGSARAPWDPVGSCVWLSTRQVPKQLSVIWVTVQTLHTMKRNAHCDSVKVTRVSMTSSFKGHGTYPAAAFVSKLIQSSPDQTSVYTAHLLGTLNFHFSVSFS